MQTKIKAHLEQCRELVQLTQQNGWIDNDSLHFEILHKTDNKITVAVEFEEIILSTAGCCAERVVCWGNIELVLDDNKNIVKTIVEN